MAAKRTSKKSKPHAIRRKRAASAAPFKAWSGRFTKHADPRAEIYSNSLEVDIRLLPYDIAVGQAHVEMLARQRIMSASEGRQIQAGLKKILGEWRDGRLEFSQHDEDVHMLVERRLHELIGPVAGKMHTARSRNDLVVTDLKLYLRDEVTALIVDLLKTQRSLFKQAEKHVDWIMPGYTHMQVAQPVLVSHWLLAYIEAFHRDEARFALLLRSSLDELPLGAAALAGTSHPIDRKAVASALGFARVTANSMDTVGDRDFCVELLAAAALCAVHMSRLAEELVWFSTSEFKFVSIAQGFSTGSSLMPQKRNPDIAELLRGRTGRILGDLVALLTILKGLPQTYNRDLQDDKSVVFNTLDLLDGAFSVLPPMLDTLVFHRDRMLRACTQAYPTATDAADHLVRQGVPFREAHAAVGRAITLAAAQGKGIETWTDQDWRKFHPAFGKSISQEVTLANAIANKDSQGGTSPGQVRQALARVRARLYPPA